MAKFGEYDINLEKADEKGMMDVDLMLKYLPKAKKAICEIVLPKGFGSGFFCKIPYTEDGNHLIPVLITCNHVLTNDLINKSHIEIIVDNQPQIISLSQRKIWADETIDFTCIEIKENQDNIHTFFKLDDNDDNGINFNSSNDCYKNQKVLIYGINNKKLAYDPGVIKKIKEYSFAYNANTYPGCSGGCIVNYDNNCIIGIHRGEIKTGNSKAINAGIFIKDVIRYILKKVKIYIIKISIIGCNSLIFL